jgi:hypothetical protein
METKRWASGGTENQRARTAHRPGAWSIETPGWAARPALVVQVSITQVPFTEAKPAAHPLVKVTSASDASSVMLGSLNDFLSASMISHLLQGETCKLQGAASFTPTACSHDALVRRGLPTPARGAQCNSCCIIATFSTARIQTTSTEFGGEDGQGAEYLPSPDVRFTR